MPNNGRRKGWIKSFTKLTLSEGVPNFVCLKSAATNEKVFLKVLALEKGTNAVFDKGFHKFSRYEKRNEEGVFDVSALTICILYKNRWIIEPLFRQIKQSFELTWFISDSQEGIKTQIIIALKLYLIFTVIHKMIKEAENFSTMVSLVAKNASSYVPFIKFLKRAGEFSKQILDDIKNVQLNLFEDSQGGGFSMTQINAP